ncbi:MAG: acetolactate synthase small subunit [Ruminococcaceae bacterium]|jgi:acetolactate synthase-1/3 small subunit|nr:acetolactate synthase small subunit [Oscillospiraceae bacterium]
MAKHKMSIISVWVEDKAGVLWHITQLFGEANCNINSLAVGSTEKPGISRMTIIVDGDSSAIDVVLASLNRITSLVKVKKIDDDESVLMELGLIMVDAPDEKKTDIINLVNVFRARIVDVATQSMTIAISGGPVKLQALIDLLRPFGILEIVRTGAIAIDRGVRSLE